MLYKNKPDANKLNHQIPYWAGVDQHYFVTICAIEKGKNTLAVKDNAQAILQAVRFYHEQQYWYCHLFMIMPDHVHGIFSFNKANNMATVFRNWKRYLKRQNNVSFQREFFDHRLRNEDEYYRKVDYIRQNPVRAGLVKNAADWLYLWTPPKS